MFPKQKSQRQLQSEVDKFNEVHKIGDKVKLKLDLGEEREVIIRHQATILGGHTAVGWFEGISGCYALSSVIN